MLNVVMLSVEKPFSQILDKGESARVEVGGASPG
jgi:hypothetical protein